MDGNRFDAWTRRRFGLAAGGAFAALFAARHADDAAATKRRCKRQGRACAVDGRGCCGKLECTGTFVDGTWVEQACCKPDGEPCTAESVCCLTNCDAASGTCKTCQGRECDAERPCCPYYECEDGYCGGCRRSPPNSVIQCFPNNGAPCCDTDCTTFGNPEGGYCVSEKDRPCRRDLDCLSCWEDPDQCSGACDPDTGLCTV